MSLKKIGTIVTALLIFFIHHPLAKTPLFTDQDCLECHGKPNLSQILSNGTTRSLYVNPAEWSQDIHHLSQMTCLDCHIDANPYLHFREGYIDVNCESCHRAETEAYQRNIHFEYAPLSSDRELPRCYHCHTRHYVLKLDNPQSSVHERNISETCGACHAEVMVRSLLNGSSLGKISGHRKGDISERFDMKVCIQCHNPSHSITGVAKDFCVRCHDVNKKVNIIMGPTHLSSKKWAKLNYLGGVLAVVLLLGTGVLAGYRSRKGILTKGQTWLKHMEKEEQGHPEAKTPDVSKEPGEPTEVTEKNPEKPEAPAEPKKEPSSQEKESE